jgi:nucleoside-diphosphate-sugar epimerase
MDSTTVLVTGGSGFIGSYCIIQLLAAGYRVKTTIRNLNKEEHVRTTLKNAGTDAGDRLTFIAANLEGDAGWTEAVTGCTYVLHVASPFPLEIPKDENEIIGPAREGTLRVLRAARDAGVKRVVLTSSFAAIGYSLVLKQTPYDETDWTDPTNPHITAYVKSKALAERAAWDFMSAEGKDLELTVINPVGVFGPVLGPDYATSIVLVQQLLNGDVPGCPQICIGAVDVRDVADLHIRAMTNAAAKGERFLAVSGDFITMLDMAKMLRARLGAAANKVPTREVPNWVMHAFALFKPSVKQILSELGKKKSSTNEKAKRILGWEPRSTEEAIVSAGESLVKFGLVKT